MEVAFVFVALFIIVFGIFEIYQPNQITSLMTFFLIRNFDTFGKHSMKAFQPALPAVSSSPTSPPVIR